MTALEARGVSVRLGRREVLAGAHFCAREGSLVGLIGPNGAGKTTLLRTMAGVQPIDRGEIFVRDRPLSRYERTALARLVGYLPQGATVHWPLTAERVVALGRMPHLHPWGRYDPADRTAVTRALDAVDAGQFAQRPVTDLSTGERARVLLARALAGDPAVLLADEPVAALDPSHQMMVLELLKARCAEGLTAVVVLHDLTLAARYCDQISLLLDGRLYVEGPPETVLTPGTLKHAYGIDGGLHDADGLPMMVVRRRVPVEDERRP